MTEEAFILLSQHITVKLYSKPAKNDPKSKNCSGTRLSGENTGFGKFWMERDEAMNSVTNDTTLSSSSSFVTWGKKNRRPIRPWSPIKIQTQPLICISSSASGSHAPTWWEITPFCSPESEEASECVFDCVARLRVSVRAAPTGLRIYPSPPSLRLLADAAPKRKLWQRARLWCVWLWWQNGLISLTWPHTDRF